MSCFILSQHLQVALDRGTEERLVQLDFSAAFDSVSHHSLLYMQRSTGVGGQFLFILSEFPNDKVVQGSVLEPLLFIL